MPTNPNRRPIAVRLGGRRLDEYTPTTPGAFPATDQHAPTVAGMSDNAAKMMRLFVAKLDMVQAKEYRAVRTTRQAPPVAPQQEIEPKGDQSDPA